LTGLLAFAGGNGAGGRARSLWRSRAALFALLGILLLASGAVLVVYRLFYDARLAALSEERRALTKKRDEAKAAFDRASETERRLDELKKSLDGFFGETLGGRKERLASLIENVDDITRKAGFMPSTISFAENQVPGADRLTLSFRIEGRYADVKKLLYAFETSPEFLVPERVQVTLDQNAPDVLRVALSVAHYFRAEGPRAVRRPVRRPVRTGPARPAPAAPASPTGPAEKVALE
jgi:hypothetical protein